jgi:N-acetyl-gamma-glutamyl-phosphate reductase uncommon form
MARIFIDGDSGTTGLEIRERLAGHRAIEIVSIAPERRKDPQAKRMLLAEVDLAILCLPDDAAREVAALCDTLGDKAPRLLDASTAHRVAPGWVYGFAELAQDQPQKIAAARRVANPGCYATGAIALLAPLVAAGLLARDAPLTISAVSGYSGGTAATAKYEIVSSGSTGHAESVKVTFDPAQVRAALKRIEKNTYGICELTGKAIPRKRLEAIPWTRFTVEAQAQLEREGALGQRRLGALGTVDAVAVAETEPEEEEAEEKPKEKE